MRVGRIALDHAGADHVHVPAARHDVDRDARVQQPHRPRQRHFRQPQQQHVALHAPQLRQLRARAEARTVEHRAPRARGRRRIGRVADRYVARARAVRRARRARRAARGAPPAQSRAPRRSDRPGPARGPPMPGAASSSKHAVRRANCCSSPRSRACATIRVPLQTVPGKRARHHGRPFGPELGDQRAGILLLAPGREHPAGEPGAVARRRRFALEHLDRRAALGKLERAGKSCNAGADDRDAHAPSPLSPPRPARTARSPWRET